MGGRKMISEDEKRRQVRAAHRQGRAASEADASTGAAQQRRHLGAKADHEERLESRHHNQPWGAPSRGSDASQRRPSSSP